MLTRNDVANQALAYNDLESIVDVDEKSDRARLIRPIWQNVFETFLAEHDWSFATRDAAPARLAATDSDEPRPYRNAFALPGDCIKLLDVTLPDKVRVMGDPRPHRSRVPYRVARFGDGTKSAIYADEDAVAIRYISNKTAVGDFPPKAYEALCLRLAVEISLNTKNSSSRGQLLMQRYQFALDGARKNDAKTRDVPRLLATHYNDARLV